MTQHLLLCRSKACPHIDFGLYDAVFRRLLSRQPLHCCYVVLAAGTVPTQALSAEEELGICGEYSEPRQSEASRAVMQRSSCTLLHYRMMKKLRDDEILDRIRSDDASPDLAMNIATAADSAGVEGTPSAGKHEKDSSTSYGMPTHEKHLYRKFWDSGAAKRLLTICARYHCGHTPVQSVDAIPGGRWTYTTRLSQRNGTLSTLPHFV